MSKIKDASEIWDGYVKAFPKEPKIDRNVVIAAMKQYGDQFKGSKKYAIDPRGDVAFNDCLKEFYSRGYRPINNEVHISRVGFNCVGIIFGNYCTWSAEAFKDLGFEIVPYEEFMKNPSHYIPKK